MFGPQIEIDLETGSDLGESHVEAAGEEHAVVVIGEETAREGKINLEMRTGETPVHRVEDGDSIHEDYPGDSFEKVGEINLEDDPQTPSGPILSVPLDETLSNAELRRKKVKTLARRTDLPWV